MTGMILYNKRNTSYFRNHVVTAHKRVSSHFFYYIYGRPKLVAGHDASSLDVSVENPLPLLRRKTHNDE